MRIGAMLGVLVGNAVPVVGILALGWSIGTVMLVICIEYLILAILATLRMAWHQRRSGDPLHQDALRRAEAFRLVHASQRGQPAADAPSATRMQAQWIFPAFIFLLMAGLVPIAFVNKWPEQAALWLPVPSDLAWATISLLLSWGVAFIGELPTLARRPLLALRDEGAQLQARAVSIALTLIFAGVAVGHFQTSWAWLPVQVVCKLLLDIKLALAPQVRLPESSPAATLASRLRAASERYAEREHKSSAPGSDAD